jgi:hypothetical protein
MKTNNLMHMKVCEICGNTFQTSNQSETVCNFCKDKMNK